MVRSSQTWSLFHCFLTQVRTFTGRLTLQSTPPPVCLQVIVLLCRTEENSSLKALILPPAAQHPLGASSREVVSFEAQCFSFGSWCMVPAISGDRQATIPKSKPSVFSRVSWVNTPVLFFGRAPETGDRMESCTFVICGGGQPPPPTRTQTWGGNHVVRSARGLCAQSACTCDCNHWNTPQTYCGISLLVFRRTEETESCCVFHAPNTRNSDWRIVCRCTNACLGCARYW